MKKKLIFMLSLLCLTVQGTWAQTDVTTEAELTTAGTNGGSVRLTDNITLTTTLVISAGKEVTIDLNGHTLSRGLTSSGGSKGHVIEVQQNATLTINDQATGGTITGGYSDCGGGIYNRGTVTISGGTISGNHATTNGGAICNRGVMTITGGTISSNESPDGGAIYNEKDGSNNYIGELTITGGAICDNTAAAHGGGAITNKGTLTITGGTITGNQCATNGGGIWTGSANSALYMAGNPVVRDNTGGDLFLNNSAKINVTGAFTSSAHICVSELAGVFTNDYSTYNSVSPDHYFFIPSNLSGTVELDGGEVRFSVATYEFLSRSWDEANKEVTTSTETCSDFTVLDKNSSRLSNGWYVVNNSFSFSNRVVIQGDNVNIILCDNKTLTAPHGIKVNSNAKLSIYVQSDGGGMGKLVARTSVNDHAAIGGEKNDLAGTVRIHGGYIDAQASKKLGAGIGGGYGDGSGMKEITIYGGTVIAKGVNNGAGIGAAKNNNYVGTINIYGGTVTANGGKYAAGIGGAMNRRGWNTNIYGGIVTATGGYNGAGIGGGDDGDGGKINIYGGTVTAKGGVYSEDVDNGGGAGIGGGDGQPGGTITIYGGDVSAKGARHAAGIGGGGDGDGGTVTIHGGKVKAIPGFWIIYHGYNVAAQEGGAGIGGGYCGNGGTFNMDGGELEVVDMYGASSHIGRGVCNSTSYDESDWGTINLGPYMEVYTPDFGGHQSKDNRVHALQVMTGYSEKTSFYVFPCKHEVLTYRLNDDKTKHIASCKTCEYKETEEAHTYDNSGKCTKCGFKTDIYTITCYKAAETGMGYDEGTTYIIIPGQEFELPFIANRDIPEYMTFDGWLQDPTTAPGTWETTGEEMLLEPGSNITPTSNVNLYARYSYRYGQEWTWTEDYSSATLKVINLENDEVVATITTPDVHLDLTEIQPTEEYPGYFIAKAEATYTDSNERSYIFTDERKVMIYYTYELNENDNTTMLETSDMHTGNVQLTNRTLYKDGSWNTLCLPFNVALDGSPLEGSTVKEFTSANYDPATKTLTLNFDNVTNIKAGRPYLVKWDKPDGYEGHASDFDLGPADLIFEGVTLENTIENETCKIDDEMAVTFMGTYSKLTFAEENRNILYLGTGNTICYPQAGASIAAQRAYFTIGGATDTNRGDVNGDETINAIDITMLVDYILGKSPEGFIAANADVNGDENIDVTDVTALVAIILNGHAVIEEVTTNLDDLPISFGGGGSGPARIKRNK